jgi:hypothetical protein
MKLVSYADIPDFAAQTASIQQYGKWLGEKPHRISQVTRLYPELTITKITEGIKNIYFQKASANKFQPINAHKVEWQIQTSQIPEIQFAEDCNQNGANGAFVDMYFKKKYFDKNDIFRLENHQQLFVVAPPQRIHSDCWKVTVVLVTNDFKTAVIDTAYTTKTRKARYLTNAHPELSETGYSKFYFNSERHVNYLTRHRVKVSWSSDFKSREKIYVQTGAGNGTNGTYVELDPLEKQATDLFMYAREQSLLFSKTNYDINGKCLIQDENGLDVPIGDGVIEQINRHCAHYSYAVLTIKIFEDIIRNVTEKSMKATDNNLTFICNQKLYYDIQALLKTDVRFNSPSGGSWYYTMGGKSGSVQKINVGADFVSYSFAGSQINFAVDKSLSQEYPEQGFGICLDTGLDQTSNEPNIMMFSAEGNEMISGNLPGMGGMDGRSSGMIATPLAGSEYHLMGMSGVVVRNPYNAVMLKQQIYI